MSYGLKSLRKPTQVSLVESGDILLGGHWTATITALVPTVNNQYKKTKTGLYLDKKVLRYRQQVAYQAACLRAVPNNRVLSVELWFESPRWITLKSTIRKADIDNLIKGTLDALVNIGLRDENIWEIKAKKIVTQSRERTIVSINDLGTVINKIAK